MTSHDIPNAGNAEFDYAQSDYIGLLEGELTDFLQKAGLKSKASDVLNPDGYEPHRYSLDIDEPDEELSGEVKRILRLNGTVTNLYLESAEPHLATSYATKLTEDALIAVEFSADGEQPSQLRFYFSHDGEAEWSLLRYRAGDISHSQASRDDLNWLRVLLAHVEKSQTP